MTTTPPRATFFRRLAGYCSGLSVVLAATLFVPGQGDGALAAEPRNDVPLRKSGLPQGYLERPALPNSALLLPPPPAQGTAAALENEEMHKRAAALRGTPRWELAARDSHLRDDGPMNAFACSLGVQVDETRTPRLHQLLYRTIHDVSRSTEAAKKTYLVKRPFVSHGETTCTPDRDEIIRDEGSYPSGHAAMGWALALVLTELAPDRADALLGRGRAYGESRIICNAHWKSDVEQGRMMGAATVARLHGEADFREDIALARDELTALRAADAQPPADCALETEVLKANLNPPR